MTLRRLGIVGGIVCFVPGCGMILGLDDYEIDSSVSDSVSAGDDSSSGGSDDGSGGGDDGSGGGDDGSGGGDDGSGGGDDGSGGGGACDSDDCCEAVELLRNGSFEETLGWSQLSATNNYTLIFSDLEAGVYPAPDGAYVAWMGGLEDEWFELVQAFSLPPGTASLAVSGKYKIESSDARSDPGDTVVGQLLTGPTSGSGMPIGAPFLPELPGQLTPNWTSFSHAYTDLSSFPDGSIYVSLYSQDNANSNVLSFFFDELSVVATVCPE